MPSKICRAKSAEQNLPSKICRAKSAEQNLPSKIWVTGGAPELTNGTDSRELLLRRPKDKTLLTAKSLSLEKVCGGSNLPREQRLNYCLFALDSEALGAAYRLRRLVVHPNQNVLGPRDSCFVHLTARGPDRGFPSPGPIATSPAQTVLHLSEILANSPILRARLYRLLKGCHRRQGHVPSPGTPSSMRSGEKRAARTPPGNISIHRAERRKRQIANQKDVLRSFSVLLLPLAGEYFPSPRLTSEPSMTLLSTHFLSAAWRQ
jgi:hypothetical protein